jgi:colicin import membrane protein
MVQASASAGIWFDDEGEANFVRRLGRAMAVSLALHVVVLAVAAWVRLPQHGERPLASIEVSLVSPPVPRTEVAEPPKSPPRPLDQPSSRQPAKAVPAPAPPKPVPAPATVAPARSSNDLLRDLMKGVELPPDAPRFGDLSPAEKPKKAQLKLPDVPIIPDLKEPINTVPDAKPRPSLTEDLNKELDEEFKKIRKIELPKPVQAESSTKPAPQVEAKVPSVKAVDTTLKVPGVVPGANAYLTRVRQRISSFWNAPPVDVTGQTYVVVVQFRLHRNGSVTGVAIERSSGNEYYDLAGKRAVLSAVPLPMFPAELTEPYFDAHFTFTVGESHG